MDNFFQLSNMEQFWSTHPDSVIFALLASRYLEQGQLQKAGEVLEEGIRRHPKYGFGHYVTGLYYFQMNDLEQARQHLELCTAYDDKNPRAWKLLGEIHEKLGMPGRAANSHLQYYLLDPFNKDAVEQYYQEDTLQFDAFEDEAVNAETGSDDTPFSMEGLTSEKSGIDEFFAPPPVDQSSLDISEKVDEVLKETLGEMSVDMDRPDTESGMTRDDQTRDFSIENIELFDLEDDAESQNADEDPESIAATLDSMFSGDLDEEPEEEEKDFPAAAATGTEDLSSLSFDEPDVDIESPDESFEEDALDFSTFVDEFIAERGEVESETETESLTPRMETPPPRKEEEPALSVTDGDTAMRIDLPEPESSAGIPPLKGPTTHFGRPPILSPTLGEIYIAQGRFEEAIDVFEQLLDKDPENGRFQKKIDDIRRMMDRQQS